MVIFKPHPYQNIAIKFAKLNKFCALILDMGLGKTIITLTVLRDLLNNCEIYKPIIVAPKFVTQHTWPAELAKWPHLDGLTISVIKGNPEQRIKALNTVADVYIVSRDNIVWLVDHLKGGKRWDFDSLVLDELSSFKNHKAQRFKAVRKIRPRCQRVIGLTGTPTPNGLIDLWSQVYLLDQGKRLYKFLGSYRQMYFHAAQKYGDHIFSYEINKGAEEVIYDKVKDICLSMKAVDWLDLPERNDIIIEVELDDYSEYKQFRRDKILELPGGTITAFNASSLYIKLLQYANGAVYDEDHNYQVVSDAKLEALKELLEQLQGKNVIISYQFQSDIERIKKAIPDVVQLKSTKHIIDWNAGKINKLLAHAKSMGHGLNLQEGGHYIIWFGVPAGMEDYWQLVKRVDRQGQKYPVFNYHLTIKGTPEAKVYKNLMDKTFNQDKLFEALK